MLAEHDHATVLYYPVNDKSPQAVAKTIVTSHLLSPVFFQKMRTEKQYGYLVGVGYVPIHSYPGIAFYIQSPHTPADKLMSAMDEFIENYQALLQEMTEQEWQQLQMGLAGQLQEKDTSLRIRSQRFWAAICNGDLEFSQKQQVISALLALTFDDILAFIKQVLIKTASTERINFLSFPDKKSHHEYRNLTSSLSSIDEISKFYTRKY